MYKRDLITSEIQKLAEILARLMRLKHAGANEEADALFTQVLQEQFGLTMDVLEDEERFVLTLKTKGLPPEKLDMLAKFLFDRITDDKDGTNSLIANRLNQLFLFLQTEYRTMSLEHLDMQQVIKEYL